MTRTAALCLLLVWALPSAAAEPETFRFHKEIEHGETGEESMIAVTFDDDVFAATRDGLPDLRVLDGQGRQTPLLIEKVVENIDYSVRKPLRSRVVSLREQGDDLKIILELEDGEQGADGLSIFTPLKDYERRVRIFGSKDGFGWMALEENGLVFDYSRFMDIDNRDVRLPKNEYQFYAVEIVGVDDVEESLFREMTRKYQGNKEVERVEKTVLERRPFRMDRIEMWKNRSKTLERRDRKADYTIAVAQVKEDLIENTTNIFVDSRRQPITELTLKTSSRNFHRPVQVQVPVTRGGRTEWRDISQGKVSMIEFGAYREKSLAISFPEQRAEEYRIVIRNEDNPPLKIIGVTARGNVYRAIFLAAADETYRLVYGSDDAERPNYDAAAVLAPLRAEGHRPSEAALGPEVADTAAEPPSITFRAILNNPLLLGAAVVVLVLLLGWALFVATRRIDRLPKD